LIDGLSLVTNVHEKETLWGGNEFVGSLDILISLLSALLLVRVGW
jgi:hypothetical protein